MNTAVKPTLNATFFSTSNLEKITVSEWTNKVDVTLLRLSIVSNGK